jgi:glycosyltransferase involved in cell wall biosynthesis
MTRTVLYELYNNSLAAGTGIATYARNLTATAKQLGYHVEGLYHTARSISGKDSILSEVIYFDAKKKTPTEFSKYLYLTPRWAIGALTGISVRTLPRTGVVIQSGPADEVHQRHMARYFYDIARLHFKRYGARATLRVKTDAELFHATQATPLRLPGAANIYTIHDLVPLRLPYATLDDKRYFYDLTRRLCRVADHIVTVSEASRRDLIEIAGAAPERVTNTYQAVSFPEAVLRTSEEETANFLRGAFELDYKGYFLFYGALEPKKNVARLIDAFLGSGSKRPLVLAGGPGWSFEDEVERIEALDPKSYRVCGDRISRERRVIRVGRLPLAQLVMLIRGARAMLFPSLYEGFGLPVLEAMLLGTPVMTSNTSSLVEVAGDAASLVDPYDVSAMAKAIAALDADEALRAELSQLGSAQVEKFSPERYGERVEALYRRLLEGR